MPFLQLKLVSKIEIGQSSTCDFSHQGGSIGRSNDCDWTLIDEDRYISNKHALISYQNEQFLLTDTSSNGVFINNSNTPLGKQNTHILKQSDSIKIGRYEISVEKLQIIDTPMFVDNSIDQVEDDDLLGLVMGDESKNSANTTSSEADFLNISQSEHYKHLDDEDELGLNHILSSASNYKSPPAKNISTSPFEQPPQKQPAFAEPAKQPIKPPQSFTNDSSIPEDWELSGILPAIPDYEPPKTEEKSSFEVPKEQFDQRSITAESVQAVSQPEPVMPEKSAEPIHSVEPIAPIESVEPVNPAAPIEPVAPVESEAPIKPIEPVAPVESEAPVKQASAVSLDSDSIDAVDSPSSNKQPNDVRLEQSNLNGSNDFLHTLYNKLGLPKEYLASINEEEFAEDIATVMLTTTKGLMSLLNSRTLFKQESRLSLTSVQPRSNNPIKFSIDPVDTLEMLILKKKKGYLTAKESYEEAVNDVQLHQMAFLSGLQATLTGVLKQLSPELIESKVNEKSRGFMGLKANSQYWQLYKEKQELLAKSVTENLNEVLSTYFSEAYQAQINNFKNDKK